jgi:hypothetical protein
MGKRGSQGIGHYKIWKSALLRCQTIRLSQHLRILQRFYKKEPTTTWKKALDLLGLTGQSAQVNPFFAPDFR